jgi:hypothetical protein
MSAWGVRAEEEGRFRFDALYRFDDKESYDFECDTIGCDDVGSNCATDGC